MTHDIVAKLHRLLGTETVFLAWPSGSKGKPKKWKHLTTREMTPSYLANLPRGNIGVALGDKSAGLCVIDLDLDALVAPFLNANPRLAGTLQTRGSRGRGFWVRCTDKPSPPTRTLKTNEHEDAGEFRSTGHQSIIYGQHPYGHPYCFLCEAKPVAVSFAEINWPAEIERPAAAKRIRKVQADFTEENEEVFRSSSSSSSLVTDYSGAYYTTIHTLEDAIQTSTPRAIRQNHKFLMRFARGIYTLELSRKLKFNRDELAAAFGQWYERVHPKGFLRPDQSREDYYVEFLNAYHRKQLPLATWTVKQAYELAKAEPLPPEARIFERADKRLFVSTCFQLQRLQGDEPIILPTRLFGDLFGVCHTTIATWIGALEGLGVLKKVRKHTTVTTSRFRYCSGGTGEGAAAPVPPVFPVFTAHPVRASA